jgi:hypothetical protein
VSSETEAVAWLRRQIEADLGEARALAAVPGVSAVWEELPGGGVLECGDGTDPDCWAYSWNVGDQRVTGFIADRDPRSAIARCEAELAVLDEHAARDADVGLMLGPDRLRQREWAGLRLAVRLLAGGYRHRDGWAAHWASAEPSPAG